MSPLLGRFAIMTFASSEWIQICLCRVRRASRSRDRDDTRTIRESRLCRRSVTPSSVSTPLSISRDRARKRKVRSGEEISPASPVTVTRFSSLRICTLSSGSSTARTRAFPRGSPTRLPGLAGGSLNRNQRLIDLQRRGSVLDGRGINRNPRFSRRGTAAGRTRNDNGEPCGRFEKHPPR